MPRSRAGWPRTRLPPRQPCQRKSSLDAHLPFLRQRWEAGCHNILQLYRQSMIRWFACFQEERRMPQQHAPSRQRLSPQSPRLSSSFVDLKNWRTMNKNLSLPSDNSIQRSNWLTTWFSSSPRCCAHVLENGLTPGLRTPEQAKSANCKDLFSVVSETKQRWWQD